MAKCLVIVESPTKSKTITKFLGKDFTALSSMGHVVDLPKSEMGVDIENGFKPRYVVIAKRRKILSELKNGAKGKSEIYLAMDPDREGEAIAFHLKRHLEDISPNIYRVKFHEITERAVKEAFKKPHELDMNMVNAQQARRILDRVLGYSLSPLLWKKVGSGLSAGRVQSVALRLIVERERKIKAFTAQEYWELEATLRKDDLKQFKAKLVFVDGKKPEMKTSEEVEGLKNGLKSEKFTVKKIKETKKKRQPSAPYTTSKLQQDAFNKLRFSASRTMKIAQELYEGLELGEKEAAGLITYMRTDSVNISKDAQATARDYIINKFGKKYYPQVPHKYKSKKSAQEAHEAVRPTLPLREPSNVKKHLSSNQFKLYELIWNRFISSQMEVALNLTTSVDIEAGNCIFRTVDTKVLFDGFMILYKQEEKKEGSSLPHLTLNEILHLIGLESSQHFTSPPPRYSDASLVKALEEKGIGRPSTYAPIIWTIIMRNYVRREKGYLHPTELGTVVIQLLVKHFPKILDAKFTAYLEEELDEVEEGKMNWVKVLQDFYAPFKIAHEKAVKDMANLKKKDIPTDQICELCGKPMVIKWGRRGKFLSCSQFPKCKFSKSITTGIKCPQQDCEGELVERRSRKGAFYGCTKFPKCRYITNTLPEDGKAGDKPEEKIID